MRSAPLSVLALASAASATASSKRGLCYVSTSNAAKDNRNWSDDGNDLTWYYNYQAFPTTDFLHSHLEFVPQLWGSSTDPANDRSFYDAVANLIRGNQMNITTVLGFNEPDAAVAGGSAVSPSEAALIWKRQFEPLKRDFGLQLGAPAVTGGPDGHVWLQDFFTACSAISNTSCAVDFIPVHWYGNFEGFTSHIENVGSNYPNVSSIWVTEYACPNCTMFESQAFYNDSIAWLDANANVSRYSYFGAFRSDISNVGPNAAFLDSKGKVTDIGSWYLNTTSNLARSSSSGASGDAARVAGWVLISAISLSSAFLLL